MSKVSVAGVLIDNITKQDAVEKIDSMIRSGQSGSVVTPYSELIVFALQNPQYREVLNRSSLSLPDGVGILWAAKYLSSLDVGLWSSLFAIIFNRQYIRSVIGEQISGSRLIYDIAKLAQGNNYSISLVGGTSNVAQQSADQLKKLYPNLNIKLVVSDKPFDEEIVKEINHSNSDILLIAYSPPAQEIWLHDNLKALNVKVAMGIGGSLDYLAGKRLLAPKFAHYWGLEWLWRLVTQPRRIVRIWNAVPVFIYKIYKYKHARNQS